MLKLGAHTISTFYILIVLLLFSILILCEKKPPDWIKHELMISQEERKGYSTEVVSMYPSKSLALIKCENESKGKMAIAIQAEIEKYIENVLDYGAIKKDPEKWKLYSKFIRQLSKNIAYALREKMDLEDIYTDEKNGVMYCMSSLKFDKDFYTKFKEETLKLLDDKEYNTLKDEGTVRRLDTEIEKKMRTLK